LIPTMVRPPKGVIFGPLTNWGAGGSKALFEYNDEGGVKKVKQFVLEDISNWNVIPRFTELNGPERLTAAAQRTITRYEEATEEDGSWDEKIMSMERMGRMEEEVIRVTDGSTAERAIEILERSYLIQDATLHEDFDEASCQYEQQDSADNVLERIVVGGKTAILNTPKHHAMITPAVPMTSAEIMEKIDEIPEDSEDEVSDNEVIRRKTRRNEKKPAPAGTSLETLNRKYDMDTYEPAVPRPTAEIVSNLYATAPPHWQLDGPEEWESENVKGTIEYENPTIPDSQELESDFSDMSDDDDIPPPHRNIGLLTVKWTPAPNSTCEVVPDSHFIPTGLKYEEAEDITMSAPRGSQDTLKIDTGLNTSKHAIPKADKAFVEQAVKEAIQEAEKIFNEKMKKHLPAEDAEMTEEKKKVNKVTWKEVNDPRTSYQLAVAILAVQEGVDSINSVEKSDLWWRSRAEKSTAKLTIRAMGDSIKYGMTKDGDKKRTNGWTQLRKEAEAGGTITQKLDISRAELAWTQACLDKDGEIGNIKSDISSIKDQLALLLASNGIGKVEEVKRADRIKAQRATEVSEDKRKTTEKRKIKAEAKKLAEEEKRKTEEQEKASELAKQERNKMEKENAVIKDCETRIETLAKKDRNSLSPEELMKLGSDMKAARDLADKIRADREIGKEAQVGAEKTVISGKVHKTVELRMIHTEKMDARSKTTLMGAMTEINKLLREDGITNNRTPWVAIATGYDRKAGMESEWKISKIREDVTEIEVFKRVNTCLVGYFADRNDYQKAWIGRRDTIPLVAPQAPSEQIKDRKELEWKLKEENKKVKFGDRLPRKFGNYRPTGFVFEVESKEEALRVVNSGIKWKGITRKVNFWDTGMEEAEKKIGFEKVPTGPKEKAVGQRQQTKSSSPPISSKPVTSKIKTETSKTTVPEAPAGRTGRYDQAIYKQSQAAVRRSAGGPGTQTQTSGGFSKPWSMVQCYTCGKFGHIQRNCNPKTREMSGNIQGMNKRPGEDAEISGNPTKKAPRKDAEKDDEGFETVRKMKKGNKKGEVRVDVIQRLGPNPRITEMSSDDVGTGYDDLTKLPPPLKSDWSDDTPIAGPSRF